MPDSDSPCQYANSARIFSIESGEQGRVYIVCCSHGTQPEMIAQDFIQHGMIIEGKHDNSAQNFARSILATYSEHPNHFETMRYFVKARVKPGKPTDMTA